MNTNVGELSAVHLAKQESAEVCVARDGVAMSNGEQSGSRTMATCDEVAQEQNTNADELPHSTLVAPNPDGGGA